MKTARGWNTFRAELAPSEWRGKRMSKFQEDSVWDMQGDEKKIQA